MPKKIRYYIGIVLTLLTATSAYSQPQDGVGQSIQINTRLHSFTGRPSWLLVIRDIDHGQNIPYVYDIERGDNFWMAFTYSQNYMITASTLQFAPYRANPYRVKVIHNFCNLESNGRISRGESMQVNISGRLSPNTDTYTCDVLRFMENRFSVPLSD